MTEIKELESIRLVNGEVKIGERIYIGPPKTKVSRERKSVKFAIQNLGGPGPFELKKATYYPRDGYPITILVLEDNEGTEHFMNIDYFIKYDDGQESSVKECEEGCASCTEDKKKFAELVDQLSQAHKFGSRDPQALCLATFKDFKELKELSRYQEMQSRLFEIANRHELDWTK